MHGTICAICEPAANVPLFDVANPSCCRRLAGRVVPCGRGAGRSTNRALGRRAAADWSLGGALSQPDSNRAMHQTHLMCGL